MLSRSYYNTIRALLHYYYNIITILSHPYQNTNAIVLQYVYNINPILENRGRVLPMLFKMQLNNTLFHSCEPLENLWKTFGSLCRSLSRSRRRAASGGGAASGDGGCRRAAASGGERRAAAERRSTQPSPKAHFLLSGRAAGVSEARLDCCSIQGGPSAFKKELAP
jgi:hypothetical protein